MSDIKLDEENKDLVIENGKLLLTSGIDAVRQRLSQRLGLFLAEWFLDRRRGLPYIQQVFVKNPNPVVIDTVFKREILAEPNVTKLLSFSLDLETTTRLLTVTFRAETTTGTLDFEEVFGL